MEQEAAGDPSRQRRPREPPTSCSLCGSHGLWLIYDGRKGLGALCCSRPCIAGRILRARHAWQAFVGAGTHGRTLFASDAADIPPASATSGFDRVVISVSPAIMYSDAAQSVGTVEEWPP